MTPSLTSRQRIINTVTGQPVDRIPIFAPIPWNPLESEPPPQNWKAQPAFRQIVALAKRCCDFWLQLDIPERTTFHSRSGEITREGAMPGGIFDRRFLLVPPEYIEADSSKGADGKIYTRYNVYTPQGMLTSVEAVMPGVGTVWEIEPLLKSVEDAHKLLTAPYRFDVPDVSSFFATQAALGEGGVTLCLVSSPLVMVSRLMQFQQFLEWTVTESVLVEKLMRVAQERLMERLDFALRAGVGPIIRFGGSEQATPPMMSGRAFDRYVLGYEAPLWKMVRQANQIVWVHCHGRVRTIIAKFRDAGVQILDPVEPSPQGDLTLAEAKRLSIAGPVTLIGNVEANELDYASPDRIEALVKEAVEMGEKDHHILSASDVVFTELSGRQAENITRFIEAGVKYGTV